MDISHLTISNEASSNRKLINGSYRVVQKIGQGQFGKVMLAEVIPTNASIPNQKYVAIKTINRIDKTRLITKTYLSHMTKIKREIQIMKECRHPNVVQLYQVIDDLKYDKILLVLEFCHYGEIDWKKYNHYNEKHLKKERGLPLNKILRDVINGLEYLHEYKHIIHRDLKPSNLLISADKTIKISDFGVSLILENNANDDKELGKTMGTPAFFAPELCQFVNNRFSMLDDVDKLKSKIDNRIDLWSLGVVLYCLIFHNLPFNGNNEFLLFKNIVNDPLKYPLVKKTPKTTSDDINEVKLLKDLINKLLAKDPSQRPTMKDIKQHAFTTYDLTNAQDITDFMDYNKKYMRVPDSNAGLATKLKKFFLGKEESSPLPPTAAILEQQRQKQIKEEQILSDPVSLSNLEPVDDLLNSYFDDSSSLGSVEDAAENFDTTNILASISEAEKTGNESNERIERERSERERNERSERNERNEKSERSQRNSNSSKSNSFSDKKTPSPDPNEFYFKVSQPTEKPPDGPWNPNKSRSMSRVGAPPPLTISNSFYQKPSSPRRTVTPVTKKIPTPLSGLYSPIMSPNTTNDDVVTIGAGSPSSIKSLFSPSRRFFSRRKKQVEEVKPTIISLSSPEKKAKLKKKYTDLKPPPNFGGSLSSAFVPVSESKNGNTNGTIEDPFLVSTSPVSPYRKNSVSSLRSGYGLTKITSSSSSLNLNAYLTDDSFSINSYAQRAYTKNEWTPSLPETEDEVGDDTFTGTEERNETPKNITSMNQFLDGID